MRMAIELGTPSKTRPCRANGSSVRVTRPALFAQKQAVGIIVESPALRDRPPLDSNRGQCEEKGRERRGEERRGGERGEEKRGEESRGKRRRGEERKGEERRVQET